MQIQARYSWVRAGASGLHGTGHQGSAESTKVSRDPEPGGPMSRCWRLLFSHSWVHCTACFQHCVISVMSREQIRNGAHALVHLSAVALLSLILACMTRILEYASKNEPQSGKTVFLPQCLLASFHAYRNSHPYTTYPDTESLTYTTVSQTTTAISKAASCAESMTSKKESLVNNPLKSHPPLTNAEMKAELRTQI